MEVVTVRKKDPKKVAAGVAGAAARKKNQQAVLAEMRDMKTALLAGEAPIVPERLSAAVETTAGSMKQLIIVGGGALLLLLVALHLSKQRQGGTTQLKVERHEDIQPPNPQHCLFTEFK